MENGKHKEHSTKIPYRIDMVFILFDLIAILFSLSVCTMESL